MTDPRAAVDALAGCRAPLLIGVRHHSPSLAVAMPRLLDHFAPDVLAIELPAQASGWLDWLTHPDSVAPLALAFSADEGDLSFFPFADFSPELVALRWAREHGVRVVCIDLPVGAGWDDDDPQDGAGERCWQAALGARARADADDLNETWDRLVEAPAPGSTPEQLRQAALAHGWAGRMADHEIDAHTLAREACMRHHLATEIAAGHRVAAVVGAYHAPALVDPAPEAAPRSPGDVRGALVGYTFANLDSRSGYPAGIRDPGWQQVVVDSGLDPSVLQASATRLVTEVTRRVRDSGHPAGPGEAAETLRVASDLASIRGLLVPSRRELIEAITTVLAQGEVLGRGRAVAAALQDVLVGSRAGRVAPGAPTSPLREAVVAHLSRLGLPTSGGQDIVVEPLRGGRDLAVQVLLSRLRAGAIAYAERAQSSTWRGADTVGVKWHVAWTAATEASVQLAGVYGLTAQQAALTRLMTRPVDRLGGFGSLLDEAAECGLDGPTVRALDGIDEGVATADFATAVALADLLADVVAARIPGATLLAAATLERAAALAAELTGVAVREVPGIAGSDKVQDAVALGRFAAQATDRELSVSSAIRAVLDHGSPLMQGAAAGLLLGDAALDVRIASWLDIDSSAGRHALRRRILGLLAVAGPQLSTAPALRALVDRIGELPDAQFVSVLPALRGGFEGLTPEARGELLAELAARYGRLSELVLSPDETMAAATYDAAARDRLAALGLADVSFPVAERWRLVLAEQRNGLSQQGRRLASALDELYGREGSDSLDRSRRTGGDGPSQVGVREWASEIEVLFGGHGIEEIMGQAAERGRADVLEMLDPDAVRPSVEMLATALSLTGALSEARLAKLRPLVTRLVRELTAALAVRLRPALTGLTGGQPTRRHTPELDLPRTIRRNLRHVVDVDGRAQIVPVTPIFRQPVSKEADWHLIVVVDVSGSMSESVVFSALTAAVLAGVNCLEVTFLAFSTEVIDFSGRVSDPLSLLLEVDVGGGTNIALALRTARSRVMVPARTLCVLISDFEEGGPIEPLLDEVTALHAAGVRLLGCAALNDSGTGAYHVGTAAAVAAAGMRVAAVSPLELAQWVAQVIRS